MRLKKYIQFIKESSDYSFGCVMIEVPVNNWDEICNYINEEDIYNGDDSTYGIQENPHLTLLYGLHKNVTKEQVEEILEDVIDSWRNEGLEDFDYNDVSDRIAIEDASDKGIEIQLNGIGVFENDDFDVVKIDVTKNELLQRLYDALSELPNSNEFPDYQPHITIAYVQKDKGRSYVKPNYKHKFETNSLCYSTPNGEKYIFEI